MKAKRLYENDAVPADLENYQSGQIILSRLAPVYYDVLCSTEVIWTRQVRAAATDGAYMYINPDHFNALPSHGQRAFILGHEVGHDVLRHPERGKFYRERGYVTMVGTELIPWDKDIAGRAMDEVINHDLVAHGLEFIPEGYLTPDFHRDMTFEEVYLTLYREKQAEQAKQQQAQQQQQDTGDMSEDDDSDSTDGDAGDEAGDDGFDDAQGMAGSESDEDGEDGDDELSGSGEEGDDSDDAGDESGEGDDGDEGMGGKPTASCSGAFDDHLEPQYDGTPAEQRQAASDDKDEVQQKADAAMDNVAAMDGEHTRSKHSQGWRDNSYRQALDKPASTTNWHAELADVVTRAGDDGANNWSKINRRRYAVTGCVTPTRKGTMNRIAITVDKSGSVSAAAYRAYVNELAALIDLMQPVSGALVMFTNTEVEEVYEVSTGAELVDLEYPRGGGTTMSAAVDYMEANGLDADVHLCFTDGEFFGDQQEWQKLADAGVVIVLDRYPDSMCKRDMTRCGIKYIVASDVEMVR